MKNKLKNILKFWGIQLVLALIFIGVFVFGLLEFLNVWTRHNQYISVPDLSQKNLVEVHTILEKEHLRYEVLDSATYNPKFPKYSVISQSPKAHDKVKKNRKIYLTINPSDYQKVSIPKVIQITRRSAEATLKAVGFGIGKITYVDDIGKDMVLKMFHQGKEVFPGDMFTKTSVIDLECGNGVNPFLPLDMTQNEETISEQTKTTNDE